MTTRPEDEMRDRLRRWRDAGVLRRVDLALADFVRTTDPSAPASLLLATALAARHEGQGHAALPLDALDADPAAALELTGAVAAELRDAFVDWPSDPEARRVAWRGCRAVAIDPSDVAGVSPLVMAGDLLYLRRHWNDERRIAAQVRARTAPGVVPFTDADADDARRWIDRLFPAPAVARPEPGDGASPDAADRIDWQRIAGAVSLRGRLTIVTGGPGTGKTWTAARLLALAQALHPGPEPLRIALAAPTGKAAARLRVSIQAALEALPALSGSSTAPILVPPARTLHALLGSRGGARGFQHGPGRPLPLDLLFVDEASMVHLDLMARLLDAMPPDARVVLLGDKDQLASVEAGAVLGELCRDAEAAGGRHRPGAAAWLARATGEALPADEAVTALADQTVVLRRGHRFDGPIARLATAVNRGDGRAALSALREDPSGPVALVQTAAAWRAAVAIARDGRPGAPGGYRPCLEALARGPSDRGAPDRWVLELLGLFDRFRVLCVLRNGPSGATGLNFAVERALGDAGLLAPRGEWYDGRPVMLTRNEPDLGLSNGDVGLVLRDPLATGGDDAAPRCWFADGASVRSVAVGRLAEVETAFATTVHKSQGSEFGHVALVLPEDDVPVLTRELLYTGITRARQAFTLAARDPSLVGRAIGRRTRRVSGLAARLR